MTNKIYPCLFFIAFTPLALFSQATSWHKAVESISLIRPEYCRLSVENDQYFLSTDRAIIQLDHQGVVTRKFINNPAAFWTSVMKKYDPATGHPYFLIAQKVNGLSMDFSLIEYRPGTGVVREQMFADSLGFNLGFTGRPVVLETSDNSFIVFGKRFYRKINYAPASGFSEEWVHPLTMSPLAVLEYAGLYIMADEFGNLHGLDDGGHLMLNYNYPFKFYALKKTTDGFVGAGVSQNGDGAIMQLHDDGTEAWTNTFGNLVAQFYDIIVTSDGGFAAVGKSKNGKMTLVKTNASGGLEWVQVYEDGGTNSALVEVLQLPDGGFVMAGRGKLGMHVIRTDEYGQAPAPEITPADYRSLNSGGMYVELHPNPSLFFDGTNGNFLTFPSGIATLFAGSLWMGGKDANGFVQTAINDYFNPFNRSDFRPGISASPSNDFGRVWAVSRSGINNLRTDYRLDNTLDEPVPFDLLTWPAKGNPNFKYNLDFTPVQTDPALFPAPFVDVNYDGIYNVYDGDYPELRGDQMAWWVFTDSTTHTRTNGSPINVDVQVAFYGYDCAQHPILSNSLFLDFDLLNRSGQDYSDAYVGFFADPDLGCYQDDFIGTLPQQDSWYVYNEDAEDGPCALGGLNFGTEIPVQSLSFLNRSMDKAMYMNNPSSGTPSAPTTDPASPSEAYNFLQGKWRDGTPLTTGGNGYNPQSQDVVNHFFSGNPADPSAWSMCTENLGYTDRRAVASTGPMGFAAGETIRLQMALTLHPDIPHPCPDITASVEPRLAQLRQWYSDGALDIGVDLAPVYTIAPGQIITLDATVPQGTYNWSTNSMEPAISVSQPGNYSVTITGATGCSQVQSILVQQGTGTNEHLAQRQLTIWPNPAQDQIQINCMDCTPGGLYAVIYNAQGQLVQQSTLSSNLTDLSVKKLPEGLYWLVVRDESGHTGVKRLVLQR